MGARQAPRHYGIRRYALSLALSVAGCGLVLLAQRFPPAQAPQREEFEPTGRRVGMAVSARSNRLNGRLAVERGQPVVVLAEPTAAEMAGPRFEWLAAAGTAEAMVTAAGEEATPTLTPAPSPTPPPVEVRLYQVQPGDNLRLIAERFGLSQDTIVWANPEVERQPDLLRIGQELSILPVDGVWHTVVRGETLSAIAARYKVDVHQIINYAGNDIDDPAAIQAGQKLIIPGGEKPLAPSAAAPARAAIAPGGARLMIPAGAPAVPVEAPAMPGRFVWPAAGIITQWYGKWHGAIDIANRQGTPLLAADAGTVTFAAWSGGLGNAIQIDHGDGFATTYGHLSAIGVQVGQAVQRGEQIGLMGTTGHSTGPHLHLIVTYGGGIVNPMDYLPPR